MDISTEIFAKLLKVLRMLPMELAKIVCFDMSYKAIICWPDVLKGGFSTRVLPKIPYMRQIKQTKNSMEFHERATLAVYDYYYY